VGKPSAGIWSERCFDSSQYMMRADRRCSLSRATLTRLSRRATRRLCHPSAGRLVSSSLLRGSAFGDAFQSEGVSKTRGRRCRVRIRAAAAPLLFPVMMHWRSGGERWLGHVLALGSSGRTGTGDHAGALSVREFCRRRALRAILSFVFVSRLELDGADGLLAGIPSRYYVTGRFLPEPSGAGLAPKRSLTSFVVFH